MSKTPNSTSVQTIEDKILRLEKLISALWKLIGVAVAIGFFFVAVVGWMTSDFVKAGQPIEIKFAGSSDQRWLTLDPNDFSNAIITVVPPSANDPLTWKIVAP